MQKTLTLPSPQPCRAHSILESLIEEWIPKLAINSGAALDARTQAVFKALWLEGLGDLSPDVLRAAFVKTLRECSFWPVKVADIRKHVAHAQQTSEAMAAEEAWNTALDWRRRYWRRDLPGQCPSYAPKLPDRITQSMRAAGVCVDYEDPDQLNIWARKRFIEYFLAWTEMEKDGKFLLPQGELREMLTELSQTKALSAAPINFNELHGRGLEYSDRLNLSVPQKPPTPAFTIYVPPSETVIESRRGELERQKKVILEKYQPAEKEATS
jgi:hypothetical protein